jgi:hypothetical protein
MEDGGDAGEEGNGGGTLEQVEASDATCSNGGTALSSTLRRRERWGRSALMEVVKAGGDAAR